jgi:iron complex transport system ATP-binding protein
MLRIEDLSFSYGNREILSGISLKLRKGIGCLLGPNGAGKSTLLKIIAGILKPQRGRILLNGEDVTNLELKERAKLISYSPQEFSINFPYTVFEVVLMGRNPHVNFLEGPKGEDEKIALKTLKLLGIESLANKPFTSLSGGQKRLVLIARALAQEGVLMVLDEPTAFLDFRNQLVVLSAIERISRRFDKLVLLSLHDPNMAFFFCDEVFLMKDGRIVANGKVEDAITEENLAKLYGIKARLVDVCGKRIALPVKEVML